MSKRGQKVSGLGVPLGEEHCVNKHHVFKFKVLPRSLATERVLLRNFGTVLDCAVLILESKWRIGRPPCGVRYRGISLEDGLVEFLP